jgi:hypothetical protein
METYFYQNECSVGYMLSIKSEKYTTNYILFLLMQLAIFC